MTASRRRRAAALLATGAVALATAVLPAAAASADTAGSNWWYDRYDVAGAQAAGWTGAGVRIGVVDGRIDATLPVFGGADLTVHEPSVCGGAPSATTTASTPALHGTGVTALLVGNGTGVGAVRGIAPKAHVTFYGDTNATGAIDCTRTIDGVAYSDIGLGIRQAVADGNRIVSISQGGAGYQDGDIRAIAAAIAAGVVLVVADPDLPSQAGSTFPHAANGVVAVNAFQPDGTLQTAPGGQPVAWKDTTVVAAGWGFPSPGALNPPAWGESHDMVSGASLAAPLVAGMLALTLQKYPEATGDQLIQSLIRNTGTDDHALQRDDAGYGYGPASLTHLLKVDPTRYPDTNPLLDKAGGIGVPTADDIAAAATAAGAPATRGPTTSGAVPPGGRDEGEVPSALVPALVVAGIVVVLVVLAVVVVLVVLGGRRRREPVAGVPGAAR